VELKVFFCWDFGSSSRHDPGFGREVRWDVPLLEGYPHEFLRNLSSDPGTHHRLGLVNPDAVDRILEWKADVVLVHGYTHWTEQDVIPRLAKKGVRVILRGESNLLPRRPVHTRVAKQVFLRWLLRYVSGVASIGALNHAYWRHYGVQDDKIFLAPYSVDNHFFTRRRVEAEKQALRWRQELEIGERTPVVLFAAKLIPVKRCDFLVSAFARSSTPAVLVIVGTGPLEPQVRALAERVAPNRVRFVGFVNQSLMPAAYALGDLFVLPSSQEPWGLAVNEAMCLGRPVVVSDQVGAAPDLVTDENGWVFPARDLERLTGIIREATADPAKLRVKGEVSSARIATWGIPETADGILAAAIGIRPGNRP
jgi:glycosyltransferase involved in cell wall biosynthesis